MRDGIININKPQGMTSNDVIYKVRAILGIKKIGHTGTLDPLATGVLPVLINRGTRVAEYMDVDFKTYRCTMILGMITDTQDITGTVLKTAYGGQAEMVANLFDMPFRKAETFDENYDEALAKALRDVTVKKVNEAFTKFDGLIEQYPPMYSAVQINGRRLYDIAYNGTEEEKALAKEKMKPRQVYIKNIEVNEYDFDFYSDIKKVTFTVECSKGTYIRTICQDVGEYLGCGATMESLCRVKSGAFEIENAIDLEDLIDYAKELGILNSDGYSVDKSYHEEIPEPFLNIVYPIDWPLEIFGVCEIDNEMAKKFVSGWHIGYKECRIVRKPMYEEPVKKSELRDANPTSDSHHHGSYPGLKVHPEYKTGYRVYREDGLFLGIAFHSDKYHKLVADKVFHRVEELEEGTNGNI